MIESDGVSTEFFKEKKRKRLNDPQVAMRIKKSTTSHHTAQKYVAYEKEEHVSNCMVQGKQCPLGPVGHLLKPTVERMAKKKKKN